MEETEPMGVTQADRQGASTGGGAFVLGFTAPGAGERARVGGKGANLSVLESASFPVPPGFTVTTDAFAAFLEETGLRAAILDAIETLDYSDAQRLEEQTSALRELIE